VYYQETDKERLFSQSLLFPTFGSSTFLGVLFERYLADNLVEILVHYYSIRDYF